MHVSETCQGLCGMLVGTTSSAQVAINSVAPAVERQNKNHIYVSGVTNKRGFLTWIGAPCHDGLSAQMKGETLMLLPRTADGFRATVSGLRSLMGAKV